MKAIESLWRSLRSLRGNQRACVLTEPLWAIPYLLFLPFASLYMSAVGLSDAEIGAVAALGLAAQFFWALLSGAIVDKLGRRGAMLLFGLLSWTIPCALWATARSFALFAAAAALNGMWRVTGNSFSCLIVEDGENDRLVHIYAILSIIGLLAGFAAPLAGVFMARFSLAPTMRALYALALLSMTAKFLIQYRLSHESAVGRRRMGETRGRSAFKLAFGGWRAFVAALGQGRLRACAALALLLSCDGAILSSFWPLFVTEKYGLDPATLSAFPAVRSVVTLFVYLLIAPRVKLTRVRRPLLAGVAAKGLGLALLLSLVPWRGTAPLIAGLSAGCDAFALAMLGPVVESLLSVSIPADERARVNGMLVAAILLATAPVTWLAGQLAEQSRALPLILCLGLVAAEAVAALAIGRAIRKEPSR